MHKKQHLTRANARTVVRAVTYLRISKDRHGLAAGVDRQREDTRALCEANGYEIVREFVDNDRSASRRAKREREEWLILLAAIKAGEVDALVAYNLDRLTRQPKELEELIDAAENGLLVLTVQGLIDLSTMQGRTNARVMMAFAAQEADAISERTARACKGSADKGAAKWTRRPYGYQLDGTVIPLEKDRINEVAAWILEEGMTLTAACNRMNDAGWRSTTGGIWSTGALVKTLDSPRNIAKRTHHGEIVADAKWEAIMAVDTYDRLCAALSLRAQPRRGEWKGRKWLAGALECATCKANESERGYKLTRVTAPKGDEWRCHSRAAGGCGMTVGAKAIESVIADGIFLILENAKAQQRRAGAPKRGRSVEDIEEEMAAVDDMKRRKVLSFADWKAQREELAEELAKAETAEIQDAGAAAIAHLVTVPGGISAHWHKMSEADKRRVAQCVVESVTVRPAKGKGGKFDLDRIDINYREMR